MTSPCFMEKETNQSFQIFCFDFQSIRNPTITPISLTCHKIIMIKEAKWPSFLSSPFYLNNFIAEKRSEQHTANYHLIPSFTSKNQRSRTWMKSTALEQQANIGLHLLPQKFSTMFLTMLLLELILLEKTKDLKSI